MKKFKIIGPETKKEFEIEDDEMLEWKIHKIKDWEKHKNRFNFSDTGGT